MTAKSLPHFFLAAIAFFSFSTTGLSCSWRGGMRPLCYIYSQAEIVFEGTVTKVGEKHAEPNHPLPVYDVTFSVEKTYKGIVGDTVLIRAISSMCTAQYEKDKRYLIYAGRLSEGRRNAFRTTPWTNEDKAGSGKEDFDFLQNLIGGKATNSIQGFVYEGNNTPVKNIRITVEGEGSIYKTLSKDDGYFLIPAVQPGVYKVRCTVALPTLIAQDREEMKVYRRQNFLVAEVEVKITNEGCSFTEFQLWGVEEKKPNRTRK